MAITDLTNTKWCFKQPSDITIVSSDIYHYAINFSSYGNDYSDFGLAIADGKKAIQYDNELVLFGVSWTEEAYRLIEITGGTDVTNATLITWLQANAVQVPVVDLTDTTWVIDSIACSAGYGQFKIDHILIQGGSGEHTDQVQIWVGYTFFPPQGEISTANTITSMGVIGVWGIGDSITITGGDDVTNPNFISWLAQHATYQAPPVPHITKLVDATQLDADLTTVANAIRTKGGTSGSLAFPSGFASAIASIPSGGMQGYTLTKTTNSGWIEYIKSDGTTGTLSAANTPVSDVVFVFAYGPMAAYINNGHIISMNGSDGIRDITTGGYCGLPAGFMLLADTSVTLQNGG